MIVEIPLKAKHLKRPKGAYKATGDHQGKKKRKKANGPDKLSRRRVLFINGGTGARSWGWWFLT